MARKYRTEKSSGHVILLVDDSKEYCEATRLVLEHEGHMVLVAYSGRDALNILSETMVDLVLLDYYMPEMTGEEVVVGIRKYDRNMQIILQTGYASENPSRDLLRRLDIQGYHDKSEGIEKLLLWVDVGLKAALFVKMLDRSRSGLNYLLTITPEMHKIQPLNELLMSTLWQFSGLLGFDTLSIPALSENQSDTVQMMTQQSFIAMLHDDHLLKIHAGTGKFGGKKLLNDILDQSHVEQVQETLRDGHIRRFEKSMIIPLIMGEVKLGVIYLEENYSVEHNLDILGIFANQVSVAIQNSQLYEMATCDQLTGVNARQYAFQLLLKELKTALFSRKPLSLILFDLDNLKQLNDTAGHSAGDRALTLVGSVLKKAIRGNDLVGRYGGDEFTIMLPDTNEMGAIQVAERIMGMIRMEKIEVSEQIYTIAGSMGIGTLGIQELTNDEMHRHSFSQHYFRVMGHQLLKITDEALYKAKNKGRNQYEPGPQLKWMSYSDAEMLIKKENEWMI